VDGGIAANLPVGIAQELGGRSIIAVDISSPLLEDDDQIDSFMSVYTHLNSLLTVQNRERDAERLGPDDILIVPDLGDISFVSFDKVQEAAAIGEEAARLQIDELRRFTSTDARWAAFEGRERAQALAPLEVDRIRLENTSRVDDRLVRKAIDIEPPEALDRKALGFDLLELYNMRYFGTVGFQIDEVENDVHELVIETPPPPHGRGSLQFGVGFLDDFDGGSGYHLQVRHQLLPVNRRGGEWETLFQIGTVAGVRTEFYQPLDWGMRWFVEPSLLYERGTQEIWFEGQAVAEYEFRTFDARLAAGRVLGRWGELRLAAFTGEDDGAPRIGNPGFQPITERRGGGEARFRIDTEDSVVFPRSGADVDVVYTVSSDALGAETSFEQIQADASYAFSFGEYTIVPYLEYADNFEPFESFFSVYPLGGLFRLSGLGRHELLGEKIVFGRVAGYRRLMNFDMVGMKVKIYAGMSLEAGNAYLADDPVKWNTMLKSWAVFLGADTFIGPAILAYGRAEGGRDRVYFVIGDTF
jgi:NTE family protein